MTQPSDPFDELAAMFLTEPDADEAHAGGGRKGTTVELLAVGHLPVRGGLWLTPYADAVAREAGPTALLRLDGEETSLQLLRGESDMLSTLVQQQPQPTLPETIQGLATSVNAWIVRPPADCGPAEMIRADADRITILSSADEAAVVAAYQLVKGLSDAATRIPHPLPEIALAVLGADSASAASVLDRLRRTTMECLGVDVDLVMCLTRMDAGIRSAGFLRFAGCPAPDLGDLVQWIDRQPADDKGEEEDIATAGDLPHEILEMGEAIDDAADAAPVVPKRRRRIRPLRMMPRVPGPPSHSMPTRAAPPTPPTTPPSPPSPLETSEAIRETIEELGRVERLLAGRARQVEPKQAEEVPEPAEAGTPGAGAEAGVMGIPGTRHAGRIKLIPTPDLSWEPKTPGKATEPDRDGLPIALAEHIAGLTILPVRCPSHERIEIALDRQGMMHLLGREDSLREMRFVETWAKAHRELISMACREHNIDPAGKSICHVFTDAPVSLADLHATHHRLHVLAPVDVDGKRGWYAAPLNKPQR